MSLFIQLPVSAPATIGTVLESDIDIFLPFDASAAEFWNFRKASLVTVNDPAKSLTPEGNYAFSGNALRIVTGGGNNMATGLADNSEYSFGGVLSLPSLVTGQAAILAGNYLNSVAGSAIYSNSGTLFARAATKVSNIGTVAYNTPLFFMITVSTSEDRFSAVIKQPGHIDFSASGVLGAYAASTSPITLGSLVGGIKAELAFYEFATYDSPLSLDEMSRKYNQAKTRMSGIGISI